MLLAVKSVQFRAFVWSSSQPQICYILIISWFSECLWDFDDALALVVRQSLFVAAQVSCCVAFCFCFPWKTMSVCWTLLVLVLAAENSISWLSVQELQVFGLFLVFFFVFFFSNSQFTVQSSRCLRFILMRFFIKSVLFCCYQCTASLFESIALHAFPGDAAWILFSFFKYYVPIFWIKRSIDRSTLTQASPFFRFVTPELLLLLLLQAKFLANKCLIQSSISAVIHFQIYRISHLTPRDLQVFSDASIPRRNAKKCCSSSKTFHRLCRWFSFLSVRNSRAAAAADFQIPCKSLIRSSISAVIHFQIYRISHLRRAILLSAFTVNVLYAQIIEPIAVVRALNPTLLSSF